MLLAHRYNDNRSLMSDNSSPVGLVIPKRFGDARGWFTEVYSEPAFAKLGITCPFVQDNHSLSVPKYTLRGLHFQVSRRGKIRRFAASENASSMWVRDPTSG
jgi:dTDP-4-dehydrorhamnose 3,5-epimerase-like enzyme